MHVQICQIYETESPGVRFQHVFHATGRYNSQVSLQILGVTLHCGKYGAKLWQEKIMYEIIKMILQIKS